MSEPTESMLDHNDLSFDQVEAWLDRNPKFFQNYFVKNGTAELVERWKNRTPNPSNEDHFVSDTESFVTPDRPVLVHSMSSNSSGAATPVRKVSAHEFERGGLVKPLVTQSIDGIPTFLSPLNSGQTDGVLKGQIRKRSRNDVEGLDETDLIFELVKDICNDLDTKRLCHKILQNVGILTNADRCSLFLVQGDVATKSYILESNLFDVSSRSTVEEMNQKDTIQIPWGIGIVGHVAKCGIPLNINDCYSDKRFNPNVDALTGYKTQSMLCNPIKDAANEVIGVAQVINKVSNSKFNDVDEAVFEKYLQFCGIGLRNAQLYERSQLEVKRNQVLLDLAGVIFQEQSTIDCIVHRILTHMLSLIRCDRAMLLLVHETSPKTFTKVFELDSNSDNCDPKPAWFSKASEGRFSINYSITSYVATTGMTINIPKAHEDPRFDVSVDSDSDFIHQSILCMPIMHNTKPNKVMGVFQLVNKFDMLPFTRNDENFVEAFGIFCGMGLHNVDLYEKAMIAKAKQKVTLDVLSYHATAPFQESLELSKEVVPSANDLNLNSFQFDDFALDDNQTVKATLRMFLDLEFVNRFHLDYYVLCRWVLSIKKNYRDVTYHNWRHAFNVAQIMFNIIKQSSKWYNTLDPLESMSILIACICHDLDHRGLNNSFQIKSSSSLAQLYSTSTMEHHHFDQCVMILNSEGNQILSNLTQVEFKRVLCILEDAILATDLSVYFRRRFSAFKILKENPSTWKLESNANLIRGMLMTACDLGAISKPWPIQKKVAELVSDEFFKQGDLEKKELLVEPPDMLNRDKLEMLPLLQVEFIDSICLPLYQSLADACEGLKPLLDGCLSNRKEWLQMTDESHNTKIHVK